MMQPLRRSSSYLVKYQQLLISSSSSSAAGSNIDSGPRNANLYFNHKRQQSTAALARAGRDQNGGGGGGGSSQGLVTTLTAYNKQLHALKREDKNHESELKDASKPPPSGGAGDIKSDQVKGGDNNDNGGSRIFTRKQVAEHSSLDRGVWITYKGNVYDITKFIEHHPGGSQTIMLGAGGDVEPFWQTYTVHHASEVQQLLAQYKIGTLTLEEQLMEQAAANKATSNNDDDDNNPYAMDPKRNPLLQVHTKQPFNAETPPKLLMPTYLTPSEIFFVRNHLPVPEIDLNDYRLTICSGTDGDPDNLKELASFTLDDLKTKFKPHSVDSVIQCSGNRRTDLKQLREIKGLDWSVGAIGNARWTGVKLLDLLDYLSLNCATFKHVQLEGLDCDMTGQCYGASISADLAFDPNKSIILAYEMNGQPLSRDHGAPLRFVAPGVTGARNVKWLGKIILSHEESNSHWQRNDYKSFSPNVDMFSIDFNSSISIQETPVQSAICDPLDGQEFVVNLPSAGHGHQRDPTSKEAPSPGASSTTLTTTTTTTIPVKGYAYSGGGKMIVRVDVSTDGGSSWQTASLVDVPRDAQGRPDFTQRNKTFAWTRWSIDIPIPVHLLERAASSAGAGHVPMEILCRAFDSSYNSQPERAETVWNVRGVVNNSWHRIKLNLKTTNNPSSSGSSSSSSPAP